MRSTVQLTARKRLLILLAGSALILRPQAIRAAANHCTLQVSPIIFAPYDPLTDFDTSAHGTISFNCSQSQLITIVVRAGNGGAIGDRVMSRGMGGLHYNVFADAAGGIIWGDGQGTQFYSNPNPPPNVNVTLPIYARIAPRQNRAAAGAYRDTLVVTIIF